MPEVMRRNRVHEISVHQPAILPSLLLCDFAELRSEVQRLEQAGVAALHLDVMDGVFVPNFTYGLPIVEAVRRISTLPLDVHLMMVAPEKYVEAFYQAGADIITIHAEAVDDPVPVLEKIRELGAAAGLAINPGTPVSKIRAALPACDVALVMSVEAGFGGQSFRSEVLGKLAEIRQAAGDQIVLQVDGGVNAATIRRCVDAGAQWVVAGSAIFRETDYAAAVQRLKEQL